MYGNDVSEASAGPRQTFAALASVLTIVLATVVLIGWAAGVPAMRSAIPGAVEMKANTAIGLVATALAVWLVSQGGAPWRRRAVLVLSAFVALLGAASFAEYAFSWNLGIDELVVRDTGAAFNTVKGRMSPYSAAVFAALGLALALMNQKRASVAVRVLAGFAIATGVISVTGYIWNASELVTDRLAPPIALNTAIAFVLLGVAVLMVSLRSRIDASRRAGRRLEALVLGGIAPMSLLVIAGGGFTYESGANFAEAAERVAHSHEVRAQIGKLYGALNDAQSAERNHVLLGSQGFEDEFNRDVRDARKSIAALGGLISDNPAQVELQRQMSALIEARIAALESIERTFDSNGQQAAQQLLRQDASISLMAEIREACRRMDDAEVELLRQRGERARAQRQRTLASLLLTLCVAAVFFALLYRGIRSEMLARNAAEEDLQRLNASLEQRVTERTQELVHQQAFLRRVIDLNRSLIFAKDRDGRFVLANEALADAYGTTVDAMIGKSDSDFNPNADDVRRFLAADNDVIDSGRELVVGEERITRADGTALWLSTVKRPILSPDGTATILLGVSADITIRKAAEDAVRELTADLEHRVLARTRDLLDSNLKLEQARIDSEAASRAKSAFVANMSHEIRTPLNAIIGLTHLLRRDVREAAQRDRLVKVSDAAHHLLSVINDVLDLSKIESGKLELEAIDFSLEALVTQACSMVADDARRKGVELVIDTDGLPHVLHGDVTRLSQALVNLLGNAVKFTSEGSVSLRTDMLDSDEATLLVRFAIRDTGIGVDAARIGSLFSAFEQADSSTTRRFGGTGLGLSITRQLAQLMGGHAGAESVVGVGSTFWFTARLERATHAVAPVRMIAMAGLRCLVIDDLPEAGEALRNIIEHLGLRVDVAASGEEGVALAEAAATGGDPYAVAVVDWKMPGIDGVETCRRLVAGAGSRSFRCVIATAHDSDLLRPSAWTSGVGSVVVKPVSASTLSDALTNVLSDAPASSRQRPRPGEAFQSLRTTRGGARVLLAEDNVINQEVAVELLRSANLQIDVASNGREAVDMAHASRYDLILMDVQMPELDGLAATRLLGESAQTSDIPVIAMTANAFGDDRAACLAAGMVDHIAKPVEPDVLYATLLRWLPSPGIRAKGGGEGSEPAAHRSPLQERLATIPGLDPARGLALFAGNASAYLRVLRRFVATYAHDVPQIVRGLALRSPAELHLAMHSLRGACASVGAIELESEARSLEAVSKAEVWSQELEEGSHRLQGLLSITVDRVRAVLGEHDDHAGTPSRY